MKKIWVKFGSISLLSVVGYSLLNYSASKNYKAFLKSNENYRDTTRPGNKSYGLNYGFKTDKTVTFTQIEDMIDTGDLLFMEHICEKGFSVSEISHCFVNKLYNKFKFNSGLRKCNWDSTGVLIRDKQGPRVLFYFFDKLYDLEYDEFLRIPFFQDIGLRKLKTSQLSVGFISSGFRTEIFEKYANKKSNFFFGTFENGVNIVLDYWLKSGLTDLTQAAGLNKIEDVDACNPIALNNNICEYSAQIIVRTKTSKLQIDQY